MIRCAVLLLVVSIVYVANDNGARWTPRKCSASAPGKERTP